VKSISQEITALAFSIDTNPSLLVGTNNGMNDPLQRDRLKLNQVKQGEVLSIHYQHLFNEAAPSFTLLWTVPKSYPVLSITPVVGSSTPFSPYQC
jgi:hypothetical protein